MTVMMITAWDLCCYETQITATSQTSQSTRGSYHRYSATFHPWTADLSIISPDNSCAIDKTFLEDLKENNIFNYTKLDNYKVVIYCNEKTKELVR